MSERSARAADWLTIQDAIARVLARTSPLDGEEIGLADAVGRTLAVDVTSPIDQPPWDNSAMDGFAVRTADVSDATRESPVELDVIESVAAGDFASRAVGAGQAIRIMTGAPIPPGADCVIRIEHCHVSAGRVAILDAIDAGRNVRARAEDLRRGETVLRAGRLLRAAEIGVLATIGRARVSVHRQPRVAILSTGDELAGLDEFDEVMAGRRIVNSNSWSLAAAVTAARAIPLHLGIARDNADSLREHLAGAADADALVTTAGASVGDHDVVKEILEDMGMKLDFWRVQMRPGSPFSFGLIGRDGAGIPVFGLPGNPVSALVTFETLVKPALRRMTGREDVHTPTMTVRAAERIESKPGLVHFLRVKVTRAEGDAWIRLTGPQGSGVLTSMAAADALLVVPLDVAAIEKGARATAITLEQTDAGRNEPGY